MVDAQYFFAQASRCYGLAQRCFDLGVARELNEMGDGLRAKARELDWQERQRGSAELAKEREASGPAR
jgi:hypothetical protein